MMMMGMGVGVGGGGGKRNRKEGWQDPTKLPEKPIKCGDYNVNLYIKGYDFFQRDENIADNKVLTLLMNVLLNCFLL